MQSGERNPLERPRSVAEIIGEALDMYQRYPLLFLALALGVIAPYELAALAATGRGPLTSGGNVGVTYLLLLLDTAMVGPLVSALHIHAVVLIGQQRIPRLGEVVSRALRVLPVVAAAVIVSTLGIALGFFALIIPGILLTLRWSVVAQVAAIEHEGWIPSLERSRDLTRGNYLHILGLLLIVGVLSAGIGLAFGAIPLGSTAGAASVAVGIALRTVTASFSALALALLYFDLRARLEPPVAAPPPQDGHEPEPEPLLEPGEERP